MDNEYRTTRILVRKATTLRFPGNRRYEVSVLAGQEYKKGFGRDSLPWKRAMPEGENGFRLDAGFWYVRIRGVPINEFGRPELAMGSVNSWPSYWQWPEYYLDSDPWPPPILPGDPGSSDYGPTST
ncbi:MAG TPA: hypothetical protein VGL59_15175 [Polyangia bacterium]|jgi:hypothetical protein